MIKITSCFAFLLLTLTSWSQNGIPEGGGQYIFNPEKLNCLTEDNRAEIVALLQENTSKLQAEGKLIEVQRGASPLFIWPVQQAAGFTYNDIWSISNYVDHNSAFPNQLSDYNCGPRTYDTSGGYNHQGIDIFTWPFSWKQLDDDQAENIAGAAGQIIAKNDGNYDRNCAFNSDPWNAVYVQHSDGSVAWYGHMKNGSLTTKNVGEMVAQGEYLGIIGSSGNSTGPHLHFEVYEDNTYTNLIDPYIGPCNTLNTVSWWQSQKPYLNPNINAVLTHSAPPVFPACPTTETTNTSDLFDINSTIYFAIYLRDQANGTSVNLQIIRPDDTTFSNWNFNLTNDYYASWWYWSNSLPTPGQWKWQATYNGQIETHTFDVTDPLSIDENDFTTTIAYPNPLSDELFIKSGTSVTEAILTDITGKIVLTINSERNIKSLVLPDLAGGVYFLTLKSSIGQEKKIKLVKK